MNSIVNNLIELYNKEKAGGLYNVLYKIGAVPSFINEITNNDKEIYRAYEAWLDFNNENSLDYLESLILVYKNQGIVNNKAISLYINHAEVLNRICFFLIGDELYTPPKEVHDKITKHAYRILKDQLTYVYNYK